MDHNEIIFTYNVINIIHWFIFNINDNNLYCKILYYGVIVVFK